MRGIGAEQLVSSDGVGRQVNQCFAAINDLGNIFVCHKNYLSFCPILNCIGDDKKNEIT